MASSTSNLDLISSSQAAKEITANALFDASSVSTLFGRRASTTTGLTFGYYGGIVVVAGTPTLVANGTIALTASQTNYIEYNPATGALVNNTTGWSASSLGYARVYKVVAGASTVTSYEDWRFQGIGAPIAQWPMQYIGTWDASTNTPTLAGGTGTKGYFYKVSVAGTQDLGNGATLFTANDSVVYNGSTWDKLEGGLSSAEVVAALGYTPENAASKDASGGYAGLTLFKLNLRNAANTITSFLTNAATAVRTWTMPDKDGTVALTNDKLSAFAATTSAELAGVLSDETGDGGGFVRANNATLSAPLALATLTDNTATLRLADAQFVKSQIAARVNASAMAQGIAMTAAASGSNGITVADNANMDMGINNFSIVWTGSVPDWTPAATIILAQKSDGTNGWVLSVLSTGVLRFTINTTNYDSTVATGLVDGVIATIESVITRESASVAGSVAFYLNGVLLGASVAITAGSPTTVDNAVSLYVMGTSAVRTAGVLKQFILLNYAQTGTQALLLYRNGLDYADKWTSNENLLVNGNFDSGDTGWTKQAGWTIVDQGGGDYEAVHAAGNATTLYQPIPVDVRVGIRYYIEFNITNITAGQVAFAFGNSGSIVATTEGIYGQIFTFATGTNYLFNSDANHAGRVDGAILKALGAVINIEPEGINFSNWFDSSTNGLNASYPAAGFSQIRDVIDNGKRLPATAVTGSATLTIAQLLTREIQDTHASGATATYTLPTAALMDVAMPTFSIGTSFEWSLINLSAAAADTCTVAAGSGHTIVGNAVIQSAHATTGALYGSTGLFRTKKTAAATYVTSRIG